MSAAVTTFQSQVPAHELRQGDLIVQLGLIPMTVTGVRLYDQQGFVVADYDSCAGCGSRTFASTQSLSIIRSEEGAH